MGNIYQPPVIQPPSFSTPDNIKSQIILWSALSATVWTQIELNANNIHIIASHPIDIYFDNKAAEGIRGVKQLFIQKFVSLIWIKRNSSISVTAPDGSTVEGFVWLQYVTGNIAYSEFYSPFEYLPTYGHKADNLWLATETSSENNLDCSAISPRFVILTSWDGYCTANLIGTVYIQPTTAVGISRAWNQVISPFGTANEFHVVFRGGLLVPSNFAFGYLNDNGGFPAVDKHIYSTINLKLL